jgi:hypothetical protein
VPKIQLYFDLKVQCADEVVAQRNAKVLKPKCFIAKDTKFYKKLQEFRSERAEKNRDGINSTQLVIAGRIIHLIDTRGDNGAASYVPYYAQRREFNQVIMSNRMISDHDIHYLVDIFENTRLCGDFNAISCGFASRPFVLDEEDHDFDVRLFICCSNPYGKLPVLLFLLAMTALALAAWTHLGCRFFITSFPELPEFEFLQDDFIDTYRISYGLYMYSIVHCNSQDGICDSLEEYQKIGDCLPYPVIYVENVDMIYAQVFSFLVETFGFISISIIMVSQCFAISRKWWKIVAILLTLTTLCQGLVMLPMRNCRYYGEDEKSTRGCQIAQNAVSCIVACCLWFVCAVGSIYIARYGAKVQLD